MKKKNIIILTCVIIVLLLLLGFLVFRSCNRGDAVNPSLPTDSNAVGWGGNQSLPGVSSQANKICIPGFDSLVFKTGEKTQKVNFYNPAVNKDRLFLMTLYIDDVEYWKSGYVAAGNGYYSIELNEALLSGEYSGFLKIQCFKPDGTELNGAKVEFNLLVTEEITE